MLAWQRPSSREVTRRLPSEGPARQALASHGGIVVTRTLDEAIALVQRLAPEHAVCDSAAVAARLTRAGTVFVGPYSAQASGDYVTGSNHVLPTGGAAAARGGLSTADFTRVTTVQTSHRRRAAPDRPVRHRARRRRGTPGACRLPAGFGCRRPDRLQNERGDDLRVRESADAVDWATAAPEREHGGLLAEGHRGAAGADAD